MQAGINRRSNYVPAKQVLIIEATSTRAGMKRKLRQSLLRRKASANYRGDCNMGNDEEATAIKLIARARYRAVVMSSPAVN